MAPCSPVGVIDVSDKLTATIFREEETLKQETVHYLVHTCSIYSSALKIEAVRSSKTSINFYQTARLHVTEDGPVQTAVRTSDVTCEVVLLCSSIFMNFVRHPVTLSLVSANTLFPSAPCTPIRSICGVPKFHTHTKVNFFVPVRS
jgi:hypothetical protein